MANDKTVFMFPGQGSQYAGMRRKLGELTGAEEDLFIQADELVGFPLSRLIDEGPDDELTRTENAQPALLVTGIAAARRLGQQDLRAHMAMGHSLGEYGALVHAGALEFADAVRLVRTRGLLMAEAVEKTPGGMAAVVGARLEQLREVVAELGRQGIIEITNFNSPSQVVLSGESQVIDLAVSTLKERRVGRAIPLNVSAPFHSSMMKPMADEFAGHLERVEIGVPRLAFIDNVTGLPEADPAAIRAKLVSQLTHPVMWEKSVRTAVESGAGTFVECGPGKALSGLVKRIARGSRILWSEKLLDPASSV